MSEQRAVAEEIFSHVKQNWPDFVPDSFCEHTVSTSETKNLSPVVMSFVLTGHLINKGYLKMGATRNEKEIRAVAEGIFSRVKENHPEFKDMKFEAFLREAEKNDCPPEVVGTFLTSSLTKSGYLESEDEGEDECEELEPLSLFERFAGAFAFLEGFIIGLALIKASEIVYNNNPVCALTSLFQKNERLLLFSNRKKRGTKK